MGIFYINAWLITEVVTGILCAALISATISSASSNLLAEGPIFTNDIYHQYINKNAHDNLSNTSIVTYELC
jgi:Na+/proline symporter